MLSGSTAQDCKLNAKYAISCAHKMGCRTFTTWEDIVEARPKMAMTSLLTIYTYYGHFLH